ncbi:hypothetical protein LTS07_009045 [Exophiala sideris]|uniref:Uncharacterized protein n=1 Tax=Exophiala sideris TaxID=1016849 RepID=A0ABR0J2M2_9EURO|nr:hypothetical protein LTS07_009045 [Exophiala sideris]KAK5030064.1 hypothetical protein LTR13_008376 [Exophiala sideris]KAK5053559.1 hypothetical protein LTR69_009203 [Exophiala sideris]KAK5179399.1 hypothetical protein LTR44_008238 [Eurotiomycetes sp. CCFEE 6388]
MVKEKSDNVAVSRAYKKLRDTEAYKALPDDAARKAAEKKERERVRRQSFMVRRLFSIAIIVAPWPEAGIPEEERGVVNKARPG